MVSQPGAIDPSDLLAACRSGSTINLALLHEILGHFVRQNRGRLDDARRALDANDRTRLIETAHAMKGSAALVGAKHLSHLAAELEHDAPGAAPALLQMRVHAVEREFEAVLQTLSIEHPGALAEPPEAV
jgi:HPt (histidine-containing phosphotransfer) domain-containing protein